MNDNEIIALAEERVKKRAQEIAYNFTENITDNMVQHRLYTIYKDSIILGARFMQEELMNLTKEQNHE